MRKVDGQVVETPVEARAGFLDRPVLVVLVVSVCWLWVRVCWFRSVFSEPTKPSNRQGVCPRSPGDASCCLPGPFTSRCRGASQRAVVHRRTCGPNVRG